jgi:hypothetical protein
MSGITGIVLGAGLPPSCWEPYSVPLPRSPGYLNEQTNHYHRAGCRLRIAPFAPALYFRQLW